MIVNARSTRVVSGLLTRLIKCSARYHPSDDVVWWVRKFKAAIVLAAAARHLLQAKFRSGGLEPGPWPCTRSLSTSPPLSFQRFSHWHPHRLGRSDLLQSNLYGYSRTLDHPGHLLPITPRQRVPSSSFTSFLLFFFPLRRILNIPLTRYPCPSAFTTRGDNNDSQQYLPPLSPGRKGNTLSRK